MLIPRGACGAENADPYLWLEEVTSGQALAWGKERNAESTGLLTAGEAFHTLRGQLLDILNATTRLPMIAKAGPYYYNIWRDATHTRGLWRRTTLEAYRQAEPAWETVLDLDALAEAEKENWVWKGANFLAPTYDRVLISLSRGGDDASVLREFDVRTQTFVADGFTLPEAKSRVARAG